MCLRFVVACAFGWALAGLAPGALFGKTKYLHTKVGNLEVLTSGSAEVARNLMYELVEVREQIKTITGSAVAPDPAMLVVIFESEKAFDDFMPTNAPKPDRDWRSTSLFWRDDSGLAISLIKGDTFARSREVMLIFYADYLLASLVPRLPLWIRVGLPEYLSTVEYRRGKISLGAPARDHRENLRTARLLPLTKLCDDREMTKQIDTLNHRTALYREAWALWHFLLTDAPPERLAAVRNVFAALRRGETGDGAAVSRAFGLPLEELQEQEKKYLLRWRHPVAQVAPAGGVGLQKAVFAPADELDRRFALAILFGRASRGLGSFGLDLLNLAKAHPDSPRPYEALASLAQGARREGEAEHYWERALENGSTNPFAYLYAARRRSSAWLFGATLRGELSEQVTVSARELLDRCLTLNPGEMEAYAWLAEVEAAAPAPRPDAVERIARSQAQALFPSIGPRLAIAHWRLGNREEARRVLLEIKPGDQRTARFVQAVRQLMAEAEKDAESAH